jgi:hypothetical protein
MDGYWGGLMDQVVGAMRNEKISSFVLVVLCLIAWKGFVWADDAHEGLVKKSEFNALITLMTDHKEEFRIVAATNAINDKELEIRICKAAGDTPEELYRLEKELSVLVDYKSCLVGRLPNCQHIRDSG